MCYCEQWTSVDRRNGRNCLSELSTIKNNAIVEIILKACLHLLDTYLFSQNVDYR